VADSQPFRPVTLYDAISIVDGGMDSNQNPLLLPKNQVAFAQNMTVRGGFMTNRPAYSNRLNITWPSDEVREAFEEGLFQGAQFYQPDSGNQSLFAAVAGRLYQFVVNGNDITVIDRTIPGDPNPDSATQAWLWQAENFLIWNDGLSLPVFFDGATTRRSYGPTVLLGTVVGVPAPASPPPIGDVIVVTLGAPYTGPYNVPVLFNGEYYEAIENAAGYNVLLTNLTDNPGTLYPEGTEVVIRNDIFGVQATNIPNPVPGNTYPANGITVTLTLTLPYTGPIGRRLILFNKIWEVRSFTGGSVQVRNLQTVTFPTTSPLVAGGQVILRASTTAPNVIIGTVAAGTTFTSAAINSSSLATLSALYSGPADAPVFIGDKQYTIEVVPAAPGTATLTLVNLTDVATAGYAVNLDVISVPELPAGRMGAYGLGQNWVSLVDGLSFIASDVSRGPSGTFAYNFRDSVLKTTDLTFRGGNFAIPGAGNVITAMIFTANLDLALGQGSLQVCTSAFMASCQAPIDYQNPPDNGPILTYSLIGSGPLGQNSTFVVNSDVYFRSTYGTGSLILARRDFDGPGNLPDSSEMERVVVLDNETLLGYGSGAYFDNRELMTVSPQATSQGVIHAGLIAKNFDTLSSLRNKSQPCWDGLWTGINILQLVGGIFQGVKRQFAFTFNISLSKIELYEILPTEGNNFDNQNVPIVWSFETGALFNRDIKDPGQLVSLRDAEFAVDDVIGTVRFDAYYKSDQGCWTPWHSFSICATEASLPQYFPRLGLGEPAATDCQSVNDIPARDGYTFQVKFVITGHCRFLRLRLAAVTLPDPKFQPPQCDTYENVEV
jgi:hypothetical protein